MKSDQELIVVRHAVLLALLASTLLASCGPGPAVNVAKSEAQRILSPAVPAADMEALIAGNTAFAADLYQALRGEDGNLFFSPHSISIALAMTYAGARGETAEQMADTLRFALAQQQLHAAFNELDLALQPSEAGPDEGQRFVLNIANSIWGEQEYTFLAEFLDLLAENYGAGMRLTDFRNAPEAAREEINEWVSDQTEDKIKNLIPQGLIRPDTRLVLANAIYFNAVWQYTFSEALTHDGQFTLLDGTEVTLPMMTWGMAEQVPYARGEGYQAVQLPYAGGGAAMLIVVPDAGAFAEFEAALTAEQLAAIVGDLGYAGVNLTMPKFSYESAFKLKDILAAMGMPAAMDPGMADFSGIDGTRNLFISEVVHKAFVDVDEEGTEAAAATAVIVAEASAPVDRPIELTLDRPFIYLIRDTQTGAVLFLGRVLNPAE